MNWISDILSALSAPFKWWVVVAPWENALRVRMGKKAALLLPGLHFKIPFLDRIYRQSMRLRTITESGITASSEDGTTLIFNVGIEYRIEDLQAVYNSLATVDATISSRVSQAVTSWASSKPWRTIAPGEVSGLIGFTLPPSWGLTDFRVLIIGFTPARAYRLVTNEYQTGFDFDAESFDD